MRSADLATAPPTGDADHGSGELQHPEASVRRVSKGVAREGGSAGTAVARHSSDRRSHERGRHEDSTALPRCCPARPYVDDGRVHLSIEDGDLVPSSIPPAAVIVTPPAQRTVTYPEGRYELRGDGTAASPYFWVWLPAGTQPGTIPPPPPLQR
jgi:hypothetical protein